MKLWLALFDQVGSGGKVEGDGRHRLGVMETKQGLWSRCPN